jgi:putative Ca2+/H+ antiporter (TMEM165/GDT1 family)
MVAFLALGTAFVLVALGEMGDKTQLLVVYLSTRYPRLAVLGGAIIGEVSMAAVATIVGIAAVAFVPREALAIASAAAFIGVGIWLILKRQVEPVMREMHRHDVFLATAGLIAGGEMGDKTQLVIIALAAQYVAPWEVFAGAVLAEVLMMVLGVTVGDQLAQRLKLRTLRAVSAGIFIVVGVLILVGLFWPGM